LFLYLLRHANDQRAGAIEPTQAIEDFNNGFQAMSRAGIGNVGGA
jgi:hypothetical protein